jgi:hypothetical protein
MPSKFSAGGGKKLGIIRYGRERMDQDEREADPSGNDIFPGDALMKSTDTNGNPTFAHHDGNRENPVYVAVEARGRGMDAQTDTGYVAGEDLVIAVRPAGGGLNVTLDDGQNASESDSLVVDPNGTGHFHVYDSGTHDADDVVAEVTENLDLTPVGSNDPTLVGADWGGV